MMARVISILHLKIVLVATIAVLIRSVLTSNTNQGYSILIIQSIIANGTDQDSKQGQSWAIYNVQVDSYCSCSFR
jgi:hypothetical protein